MGQVPLSVYAAAAHHSPCSRYLHNLYTKGLTLAGKCHMKWITFHNIQACLSFRGDHLHVDLLRDKYMGRAALQEMHLSTLEILQSITYLAMHCTCNIVSYAQLGSLEHLCSVHVLG